jgi:hypothetical protein
MRTPGVGGAVVALALVAAPVCACAQQPLTPAAASGRTVTPAFEGWYVNPDGTYSISFGYYNRNTEEVVEIPVGPDNRIEPGDPNQGQPSTFYPRRHWGVFAITVPKDFGDRKVVWTLRIRGETFAIPGSLHRDWQIDALAGEAGSDNTPPAVRFDAGGPEGRGPLGIVAGPVRTAVGSPLTLPLWVTDDGKVAPSNTGMERQGVPLTLTWFKHQGPGDVMFSPPTARVSPTGGTSNTKATFSRPGEYVVRVRVNDSPVATAGHAQCCWTNGFVKVTVTP